MPIVSDIHDIADHPRSRGVDDSYGDVVAKGAGSSPLARGRLNGDFTGPIFGRIIPARAGSTTTSPTTRLPEGDHPRSRGVD